MGLQSSRLYYNGKVHKDIYYNGKYHNAMYLKDQGGYIWRKLANSSSTTSFGIVNSLAKGDYWYYGYNVVYPDSREIVSETVKAFNFSTNSGNECFNKVISGKNRAFGYLYSGYSREAKKRLWVTSDGKYWKKINTTEKVNYIYPCYNGLLYKSFTNQKNLYKIVLDDDNNIISETLIYSDNSVIEQPSNNGCWCIVDDEYCFIEHANGMIIKSGISRYDDYGNSSNYGCFKSDVYNYMLVYASLANYGGVGAYVLKTSGSTIESTDATSVFGNDDGSYYGFYGDIPYEYNGEFYFFRYGSESAGYDEDWNEIYKSYADYYKITNNFSSRTLIKRWYEDDYIELDIIGGVYDTIESVRYYPAPNASPTNGANYISICIGGYNRISTPYYIGNTMTISNGILTEISTISNLDSAIGIYLNSWIIDENINGFCYFTANVGVGVSYP